MSSRPPGLQQRRGPGSGAASIWSPGRGAAAAAAAGPSAFRPENSAPPRARFRPRTQRFRPERAAEPRAAGPNAPRAEFLAPVGGAASGAFFFVTPRGGTGFGLPAATSDSSAPVTPLGFGVAPSRPSGDR